ncbi:MAG: Isoniazid-inducible protein iniA [Candidatus Leucobacter sulfamidivorax]|nr:Isoniazid-inducible protein iniA [Candidatus Leucobacter sulfamidivorax]
MPSNAVAAERMAALADRLRQIALRSGRQDLADRVAEARAALDDAEVQIVVVGQFKQGKSTLVNTLVSAPVCPVDDVIATSVPTVVRWGEQTSAALITELAGESQPIRAEIDPRRLREHVTEMSSDTGIFGNLHAEVTLPSPLLAEGLVFMDTPGVGRAQARVSTNLTLLPQADAALVVTDATQELTDPELAFLRQSAALCSRVTCIVSKIDLHHQWRSIVQADVEHLSAADIDVPVMVTSALLHEYALMDGDPTLREESRIDALTGYLRDVVKVEVIHERQGAVAREIDAVCELIAMSMQAEIGVLDDPSSSPEIVRDLKQAEETAENLTRRSARWQQTLSDGIGDLISDIEFDLRDRLREVGREAEQLIAASDPGKSWEDIGAWLADSVTQAVSDNFVWAHERSVHLAEVVAQHFSLDGRAAIPTLSLDGTDQALRAIGDLEFVQAGKLSLGQKVMIGLRGSYSGILMFGLMTTLAGLALVNPISLAAGLIVGGFAYRQDALQRLDQRRNEAKTAVRKLIDEAIFQVGKESRDRMNRIRRVLRDHFVTTAEEVKRSLAESIRVAQQGAALPPTQRDERAAQAAAELQEIRTLQARAREFLLLPAPIPQEQHAS